MAKRGPEYSDLKAGIPRRGTEKATEPDRFYLLGRAEAALAQQQRELARAALEVLLMRKSIDEQLTQLQALQAQLLGLLAATAPAMTAIMGQPAAPMPALPGVEAPPGPALGPAPLPEPPAMLPGRVVPGMGLEGVLGGLPPVGGAPY
jgi:hypothetical protein